MTQELIDKTSSENLKTFIVFDNGTRIIALTRVSGKEYIDNNGNAVETVYDPQAFDMLNEYFEGSKQVILEEIYAIYQDAEKGGGK